MDKMACHLDTSYAITGHNTVNQETSHHLLGICGQCILADWYTPRRTTVLSEAKLDLSLSKNALVLDQQSILDSGICLDQWTLCPRCIGAKGLNYIKWPLVESNLMLWLSIIVTSVVLIFWLSSLTVHVLTQYILLSVLFISTALVYYMLFHY